MTPMQAGEAGVGQLHEAAPVLAAVAAVGWTARHGGRAGPWKLVGDMVRGRSRMRAERERRYALVELVERLPPGSRLVVRESPGGQSSLDVRTARPSRTTDGRDAR
ncbi:hypothetical protein BX281_0138 [Streptomyces sp. Ag82_O1-15]|uniref:hypothetical protein n=1 Tax=Streptomyces sp. Ag82_O1-15 TaxID=1938855 RepID=UPI000BD62D6A|nr:hypothetical protein [Streptomyces sp. Ag82_O1-15]PBC92479.1 hypothetical protein BX281_0138 [Streptomyces sp. Ag82_O1-15]